MPTRPNQQNLRSETDFKYEQIASKFAEIFQTKNLSCSLKIKIRFHNRFLDGEKQSIAILVYHFWI